MSPQKTNLVAKTNDSGPLVKVDLKKLIAELDFSQEGVAQAMLNQPKLLLDASYYRVEKMKARLRAEAYLDQARVSAAINARATLEKVTENGVIEQVGNSPEVIAARKAFDEARAMEEWAKLVIDSYQMRGSMLKAYAQLLGAEAALESGVVRAESERMGIADLREKVLNRFPKGD